MSIQKPIKSGKISFIIGIDGKPIGFEWNIFPGRTTFQILQEIQDKMRDCQTCPEEFELKIESSSCLCSTSKKGNYNERFSNSEKVKNYAKRFQLGLWSFLSPGEEEKWYGTHTYKLEGMWNITAGVTVDNFKDSGHTVIRATSALDRGFLKKKGGKCTIHFSAEFSNAELFFCTIHSANQLSIHGAVANFCDELTQLISG